MATEVNSSNFDSEVMKAKGLVVADFWAEWCGPCKRYGPLFNEFAQANKDKAKFVSIDVENAEDIASNFGVQSIPTTIFFKDGKVVHREVGMLSKEYLADAVKKLG